MQNSKYYGCKINFTGPLYTNTPTPCRSFLGMTKQHFLPLLILSFSINILMITKLCWHQDSATLIITDPELSVNISKLTRDERQNILTFVLKSQLKLRLISASLSPGIWYLCCPAHVGWVFATIWNFYIQPAYKLWTLIESCCSRPNPLVSWEPPFCVKYIFCIWSCLDCIYYW